MLESNRKICGRDASWYPASLSLLCQRPEGRCIDQDSIFRSFHVLRLFDTCHRLRNRGEQKDKRRNGYYRISHLSGCDGHRVRPRFWPATDHFEANRTDHSLPHSVIHSLSVTGHWLPEDNVMGRHLHGFANDDNRCDRPVCSYSVYHKIYSGYLWIFCQFDLYLYWHWEYSQLFQE